MLKVLKEQLMNLSKNDADDFSAKIRSRLPGKPGEEAVESLKSLILLMPSLISQIRAWANDPRIPARDKELHGFILTYLYHPVDFLPESEHGLFGYLDDAYFVGAVYANALLHMDYGTRQILPHMKSFETDVPRWLTIAKQVIPEETKKMDALLQELIQGREDAFHRLMSQEQPKEELV
jgi:uncharacterized membrane protein YkvA (DUF1232 family)